MGFQLFLLLEKFLMLLPKSWRKLFFISLAKLAFLLLPKYKKIAQQNLDFVFADKLTQEKKDSIIRYSFKNLALNFLHLMELRQTTREKLAKRITLKNTEIIDKIHKEGRAVIYITPHYSSWELGGASLGAFIEPIIAVYKKMKNPSYEKWVLDARGNFGNTSLEKTNVIKPLIRNIKKGGACGILFDTNLHPREGVIIDFMGHPLRQTSTPAYLARKYNAAIVPACMTTDDDENYTLEVFDEIPVAHTEDEQKDILEATQKQADWLAFLLQREPKFWFWLHRRFKTDHPHIYKK